jgi:hypothetical protein
VLEVVRIICVCQEMVSVSPFLVSCCLSSSSRLQQLGQTGSLTSVMSRAVKCRLTLNPITKGRTAPPILPLTVASMLHLRPVHIRFHGVAILIIVPIFAVHLRFVSSLCCPEDVLSKRGDVSACGAELCAR